MARKKCKKNINGKDSERFGKIRMITDNRLITNVLMCFIFLNLFYVLSCSNEEKDGIPPFSDEINFELDEKTCTDFAVKMHSSIANGDSNFIKSYIDWKGIQQAISKDTIYWDENKLEIFKAWKENVSPGNDLMNELNNGSHLRFITYYHLDGEHFIILRNYIEPQTVNYVEIKIVAIGNSLAIADLYDFSQSMLLSEMGAEYCNYLSELPGSWLDQQSEMLIQSDEIRNQIQIGDFKNAYAMLNETNIHFQNTYLYRDLKEQILMNSGSEEIAMKHLFDKSQRISVNEKGRSLTMFYLNAYAGKNNDALIALANLESAVGDDGVIDFLRGNIYFEKNELNNAILHFNKALAYNSKVFSFHIAKIKTLIELSYYVEAVESLLVLDDFFDIESFDWDAEFIDYPDFMLSDEYGLWLQRLTKN
jgi:tetratricopeptide (TPR) repeat protein